MSRGNALVAFLGGMGAGYFKGEKDKEEKARQDKQDQMAQETHDLAMAEGRRKEADAQASDAVDAQVAKLPTNTYGTQHDMGTEDVRSMMGGSADPSSPNYVSDEAAQHYKANVTGTDQVNSNAAYFAKQGLSKGLDGQVAANSSDGMAIADPKTATEIKPWRRLEEAANVRINSNVPAQQQLGYQALAHASELKSRAMTEGLAKAKATGDPAKTLEFLSNWDNKDLPVTDMRLEDTKGDGTAYKVYGTVDGKEKVVREYDMSKLPKGWGINDAISHDAQAMVAPDKIFEYDRQIVEAKRTDAQNEKANSQKDTELGIKRDEVTRKASNDEASNAEAARHNKATEGLTAQELKAAREKKVGDNLPASAKEAEWYAKASPAFQAAFDKIHASDPSVKVTPDALGGATIVSNGSVYQLDRKGEVKPVALPAAGAGLTLKPGGGGKPAATPKANRPPLDSFMKQ